MHLPHLDISRNIDDNGGMSRGSKWPNEEMWNRAAELRKAGLTYGKISGRIATEFELEEVPSEDTVRRHVAPRLTEAGADSIVMTSPPITKITFTISSLKRIDIVDEVLGLGKEGSYQVYGYINLVTSRPVRLDGVAMTALGQHVIGHLILQGDNPMRETGTYLAGFNIPPELCYGNPEAGVVIYANGLEFHSENKERLNFGESP